MEFSDRFRWMRRSIDFNISYRKLIIIVFLALAFLLYVGPYIFKFFNAPKLRLFDPAGRCLSDRLTAFLDSASNFDANIRHTPLYDSENQFIPFVGNGKLGVVVESSGEMYLKSGRVLSVRVPFRPVITLSLSEIEPKEASILHYTTGLFHRFHCFNRQTGSLDVHYVHYTHRTMPSLFLQEIKITNPTDSDVYFDVTMLGISDNKVLEHTSTFVEDTTKLLIITGKIPLGATEQFFALAVIHSELPATIRVRPQSTESAFFMLAAHYMGPVNSADYKDAIQEAMKQARLTFTQAMKIHPKLLKDDHKKVWQQLWNSGFGISNSKASNALNGDKINATIYYVLSNTRSPLHEVDIQPFRRQELSLSLTRPDRCYDGHHTLQASTLWSHLNTIDDVINVVSLWKLTLEKQGCLTLLQAGADGVIQAILLSFGALKFSDHHLEFCTHPKDLHRDYEFRRIMYGNGTNLNISVIVREDNKAVLYVAVDRSDKNFYACDGGCLDLPVQLGTEKKQFPVKLTEPPTAILYITDNKQHMEELKHTIHVKEVVEAPAHEHHIIALHRHGHHLGGLPTLFWVSIAFLVLVFHLFLFKLIYNEYCTNNNQQEKARARYAL